MMDKKQFVVRGMEAAITKKDHVSTAYRDHGFQYTRGDSVTGRNIFAEMFGKETGCATGKSGSMHLYYLKNNFYAGNGIVGAQVAFCTGIAFASKNKKDQTVCVTIFDDGGTNQGQVFKSFNMAALWKVPVIYLVENNRYSMSNATHRASAVYYFYTRWNVKYIELDIAELHELLLQSTWKRKLCISDGIADLNNVVLRLVMYASIISLNIYTRMKYTRIKSFVL